MSNKMCGFIAMNITLNNGEVITLWSDLCTYQGATKRIEELPDEVLNELLAKKLISPIEGEPVNLFR